MVFHDAGGAAAVAPLIPTLKDFYVCRTLANDTAASVLSGCTVERCSSIKRNEAIKILREVSPHLLIAGTSAAGKTIDRTFIAAAKELHIPTLVILDYWSGYRIRFADTPHGDLHYLPDRIAVMDKDAQQELIKLGIPPEQVIVTGSPRFQRVAQQTYDSKSSKAKLAGRYNIDSLKPWILFLSQTFGNQEKARAEMGYTERDAAKCLLDAIAARDVTLLVRLHPSENAGNRQLFKTVPCTFAQDIDINELISACDIVTGMSTVALVDAYLMKKPVISIQPGQKNEDLCYLTSAGLIPKCQSTDAVRTYIDKALNTIGFIDFSKSSLFISDAFANNMALIAELVANKRHG